MTSYYDTDLDRADDLISADKDEYGLDSFFSNFDENNFDNDDYELTDEVNRRVASLRQIYSIKGA